MARPRVESGVAQPDALPFLRFFLDGVQTFESGNVLSPTTVIQTGNTFNFRTELGFEGILKPLLNGHTFEVFHHLERIEDGVTSVVAGGNFVVPAAGADHITVTSAVFNAGVAPFDIPGGFAAATHRIMTHVHADDAAIRPIVAAFHDGLILMIT